MTHEIRGSLKLNPGSAPTAAKGVLYYDTSTDEFKGCTDGATFGSIGGGGTLQDAYDGGNTIAVDTNPVALSQAAGTNAMLSLTQNAVGNSIFIDHNTNEQIINIDADGLNSANIINASVNAGEVDMKLGNRQDSLGTFYFKRNVAAATTAGAVLYVRNQNTSDDQPAIEVLQDAPAIGVTVSCSDSGGNSGFQAFMTGSGYAFRGGNNAGTNEVRLGGGDGQGRVAYFYNNVASPGAAIVEVNSGATDGSSAFTVIQNSGSSYSARFYGGGGNNTVFMAHGGGNQTIYALRNQDSTATSGAVVRIQNANSGDDQPSLYVYHQSTGNGIQMLDYGTGQSIRLSKVGSATHNSPTFSINRSNTNHTGNTIQVYEYNNRKGTNMHTFYMYDYSDGASTYDIYIGTAVDNLSGLPCMRVLRNVNTSGFSAAGALFSLDQLNSSDNKPLMVLNQAASSTPFIHFQGTSQGTGHTSIAESVAVRGPSGTVRYINLYS